MNSMNSIFQLLKLIPDFPAFIGLFNDISATIKDPSQSHIESDLNDLKPLVEKWLPNIPPAKIDTVASVILALTTLREDHSTHNCEVVAGFIVESLPTFGVPITQEHADNLVKALADALGDFGIQ